MTCALSQKRRPASFLPPTCLRRLLSNRLTLLGGKGSGPRLSALQTALAMKLFRWIANRVFFLAGGDPHNANGVAYDVSGAALAFRAGGHGRSIELEIAS